MLDWLLLCPQKPNKAAEMEMTLIDILMDKKVQPESHPYITVLFGAKEMDQLQLPRVLHHPNVYSLHPQPEVATSIRISERHMPRLDAMLMNVAKYILRPMPQMDESLQPCACQSAIKENLQEERKREMVKVGHVLSSNVFQLKWPCSRKFSG